jgi:hypothetical protein
MFYKGTLYKNLIGYYNNGNENKTLNVNNWLITIKHQNQCDKK